MDLGKRGLRWIGVSLNRLTERSAQASNFDEARELSGLRLTATEPVVVTTLLAQSRSFAQLTCRLRQRVVMQFADYNVSSKLDGL